MFYGEKPICIVTYNELQAKKIMKDLEYFTDEVNYFPKREIVTYDFIAESKVFFRLILSIFFYIFLYLLFLFSVSFFIILLRSSISFFSFLMFDSSSFDNGGISSFLFSFSLFSFVSIFSSSLFSPSLLLLKLY